MKWFRKFPFRNGKYSNEDCTGLLVSVSFPIQLKLGLSNWLWLWSECDDVNIICRAPIILLQNLFLLLSQKNQVLLEKMVHCMHSFKFIYVVFMECH